ncbi:MAG: hypothetical protein EU536_04590 [Promethearchaeota archaeon]|nr:MAG: hypothetical protein EU536_04590 [Candidatus Lokiarchaeota archaeon]
MPFTIICIILVAGFGLSRTPLLINYINKHIPSPERATVNSTVNMFQMLAYIAAMLFVGYAQLWSLAMTLSLLGIIGIIASLIFRRKVKEEYLID